MDDHNQFLIELDQQIQSKHLLTHEFYKAWSRGDLSLDCLREYAKEYYHHVKAFPTYLSAVHSRTDDEETRVKLLHNLIEEEAGLPNHPGLWKNFALATGATQEEIKNHQPSEPIQEMIATFRRICSKQTTAEGIAALYAYESQIPEICISKIDGLKNHYHMENPKNWQYFSVHIAADKEHAAEERELLQKYVNRENQDAIRKSVSEVLDGLWNFLSSLCDRYQVGTTCSHC